MLLKKSQIANCQNCSPLIIGVEGEILKEEEAKLYKEINPLGFILMGKNCLNKEKLIILIKNLRNLFEYRYVPILIDQEGGIVQRIKPPLSKKNYLSQKKMGDLYDSVGNSSLHIIKKEYKALASELNDEFGINIVCSPVLDLIHENTNDFLLKRCFSSSVDKVKLLSKIALKSINEAKILGVIKHIPGHGRASDSHISLPIVENSLSELENTDFKVFKQDYGYNLGMISHIIYNSLDIINPASKSRSVINYIRNKLNFNNLLITDDICMKAVSNNMYLTAKESLRVGCDIVLMCHGTLHEKKLVSEYCGKISNQTLLRFKRVLDFFNNF